MCKTKLFALVSHRAPTWDGMSAMVSAMQFQTVSLVQVLHYTLCFTSSCPPTPHPNTHTHTPSTSPDKTHTWEGMLAMVLVMQFQTVSLVQVLHYTLCFTSSCPPPLTPKHTHTPSTSPDKTHTWESMLAMVLVMQFQTVSLVQVLHYTPPPPNTHTHTHTQLLPRTRPIPGRACQPWSWPCSRPSGCTSSSGAP